MRYNLGRLALITAASAIASAIVTTTTKIMSESASSNGEENGKKEGDEKKAEGKQVAGQEGLIGRINKFVQDIREQLPKDFSLPKPPPALDSFSMEGVVRFIQAGKAKNIIVMTGAGISTSAGIPDFRSPGIGLYDNLEEYNLPDPQAVFDIGYFKKNPEPFFKVAKKILPAELKPTPCHYFIRLLHEKGMLSRVYTQNVDALEHVAGIPECRIVEAHGTFRTGHCTGCGKEYDLEWMRNKADITVVPHCDSCNGIVKPDVVFFGEALPTRFFGLVPQDFGDCDLLLIMGTSLIVEPFASLVDRVGARVPRMLINMDKSGKANPMMAMLGLSGGLQYDEENNYRDVFWQGTCDDGCTRFADLLGWGDELRDMIKREWAKLDAKAKQAGPKTDKEKDENTKFQGLSDSGSKI